MTLLRFAIVLAAAVLAVTAPAAAKKVSDFDRFSLWNECGSMTMVVENLPKDAAKIGLKKEAVTNAVRSKLRSARIYNSEIGTPWLYVRVSVVDRAHHIGIHYNKRVRDVATGLVFSATTWGTGGTGTHGGDAGYILSFVSQHMDNFIDDYLRVNALACKDGRG